VITFHNGQWPHFQLALLALFSVGVNTGSRKDLRRQVGGDHAIKASGAAVLPLSSQEPAGSVI
jgi:hypothetical protein